MRRSGWRRPVHVSWVIALGCTCFVIGVALVLSVRLSEWWLAALGIVFLLSGFWVRKILFLPIVAVGALSLGLWYGSLFASNLEIYEPLYERQVALSGRIKEDPSLSKKGSPVLQLDSIDVGGHELPGVVWVSVVGHPEMKRGDVVTVGGTFEKGFGTFAGTIMLAKVTDIIRPIYGDLGRMVRDWFADAVRVAIPEPQASLGTGFLTGQKSALPPELATSLQIAGLSHIVVASGYNLTILVRLARRLLMRISKFVATAASLTMIGAFVAVTGMSPSMSRAGLVATLSLLTWYYGRRFHPFVLLPFAAAITVAWQPSYAWGDLGWQLSFSAFMAVILLGPLLQKYFFGDKKPGTVRQILGETVAAHIVTIPIIALSFGVLSHVAIPANLLIVPFVPLAMLLTFFSGILGLIAPMTAEFFSQPTTWLLTYMTQTADYLANLPWAQSKIEFPWWGVPLYYLVLTVIMFYLWRRTKLDLRETNIVI